MVARRKETGERAQWKSSKKQSRFFLEKVLEKELKEIRNEALRKSILDDLRKVEKDI